MTRKEKWNKIYDCPGYFYGTEPSRFLKEKWKRLRSGKILDLAMGEGRNAVFLAANGFQVSGFDISDVAVDKARKLAYEKGVAIETKVVDLDLYLFPMFGFDSILLSYFKPLSRYYTEIYRALVQGGTVLIEGYTTDQLMKSPLPEYENHDYFHPNELLRQLQGFQIIFYNEEEIDGRSRVQCIAKKPTDRDAVKYGFAKEEAGTTAKFKSAEDLFKKK